MAKGAPLTPWIPIGLAALVAGPAGWLAARVARPYASWPGVGWRGTVAAAMAVFTSAAVSVPADWRLAASLGLGWMLVCLATIDLVALRLPDVFTLPLLGAGLAVAVALPGRPLVEHLAGAAIGYGLLALLAWGYRRWRGVDGVGLGDAKLLAAAGAWLGWTALPSVLLIACVAAFAWIGVRRLVDGGGPSGGPIAFGAPLCLAIWVVWLAGPLAI